MLQLHVQRGWNLEWEWFSLGRIQRTKWSRYWRAYSQVVPSTPVLFASAADWTFRAPGDFHCPSVHPVYMSSCGKLTRLPWNFCWDILSFRRLPWPPCLWALLWQHNSLIKTVFLPLFKHWEQLDGCWSLSQAQGLAHIRYSILCVEWMNIIEQLGHANTYYGLEAE